MTPTAPHLTDEQLAAGWPAIAASPKERGTLAMIVRRPAEGTREILVEGQLDLVEGLVGDSWRRRGNARAPDGRANVATQLNVMNARVIALLAQSRDRWPLAGDQLLVDLDLSEENLPPGSRLAIGAAIIEVTAEPHTGCAKFAARYGRAAAKFVNSPAGKRHHLRGINAKVVQPGTIREGDAVRKLSRNDSV